MALIEISLDLTKVTSNTSSKTRYKETKMKEIISASCALLNSNGGKVVMHIKDNNPAGRDVRILVQKCIRMIEQRLMDIIGSSTMVSNISFEKSVQQIVLCITRSSSFITTNYNLDLPSETQLMSVPCTEHVENVKEAILNRKVVVNPVMIGSHQKEFVKNQNCGQWERKTVEFKSLKSVPSNCVTLADRIINKSNKLSGYVSAFANHSGGHIYYGITDNGIVEGEVLAKNGDIDEITKKVTKTMNKLIWPDYIGKPQRGEQWDIFFHPVHDVNSTPVPSTYVIVIYVAPCIGGVFTETPESYAMIDGEVAKMTFPEWKSKMLYPMTAIQSRKHEIPSGVQRCTWSSPRVEKACTYVNTLLMPYINNGDWSGFSRYTNELEMKSTDSEVKLAVLSKRVTAYYRRGRFSKANECLEVYNRVLPKSKDILIFEVIGLYLQAAMERSQGKFQTSYKHLTDGLVGMVEQIPAGLISAAFYSLTATLKGIKDCTQNPTVTTDSTAVEDEKPEILSTKALEHLQGVDESPTLRVDMEQKAHINLALLHLGCSLSGNLLTTVDVDDECIAKANWSLMAVNQSVCEGYPLTLFRKIQFNFAMSILHYRRSKAQLVHSKRVCLLQSAFNLAKEAGNLARECQFDEMVRYSQKFLAICTEELVRIHSFRKKVGGHFDKCSATDRITDHDLFDR